MPNPGGRRIDEFDGDRLSLARLLRGHTKTELADRVGLSAAAITQFERGLIRPRPEVLVSLAFALQVPAEFFSVRPGTTRISEHEFHFRRLRSSRKIDRARVLARTTLLAELVTELEKHVVFPAVQIPTEFALPTDEPEWRLDIERAAQSIRSAWSLGEGPISNMVWLLETKGCIVTRLRADSEDIDAFSGWWRDRPYVVLASDKSDAARSRFDAAHELGHLVLHPDPDPTNRLFEVQAHLFASAFLMPAVAIARELPPVLDLQSYVDLKSRWKVSLQALFRRATDVGRMTTAQYRRAMTVLSARGWRMSEPGEAGLIEAPVLMNAALDRVLEERGINLAGLAARIHLGRDDTEALFADSAAVAS
jgi:Zn-dependent peptidase ImmA (M78 family)/transcriptional regulator with XRE-family HTH domain